MIGAPMPAVNGTVFDSTRCSARWLAIVAGPGVAMMSRRQELAQSVRRPLPIQRVHMRHMLCGLLRHALSGAVLSSMGLAQVPIAQAAPDAWPVAGRQGLVRFVIVPALLAADREAYRGQTQLLCEPERTCFLNFYTNSTGAAAAVPLPDAIDKEATAVFRRSAKQGAEKFMWSCRMKFAGESCF